jgi:tRNA pseudouridine38-40 synthase
MPRYKIIIEYDGQDFVGWQRQKNGLGVQQVVEEAITKFCGDVVTISAAGRTDSGVHALGQVASFDLKKSCDLSTLRDALNFHLKPSCVSILAAEDVGDDFDARFSACQRIYSYRIINRRPPLALDRGRAWWVSVPLDASAMDEAAKVLVGHHDFTTFRAVHCQAESAEKTLDVLNVRREGDDIFIGAKARSFLHHQVRNIAGTLKLVGEGKWTKRDVEKALAARDRSKGGPTAPACGLCLIEVVY